ncbi:MAG: enoyl-CoA hydratase-related protein [Myxococcota bacterium]
MQLTTLRLELRAQTARILLDRPDKRNAMDSTMAWELAEVLDALESDPAVRAVLIRGAGGQFCSGGDLAPAPATEAGRDFDPRRSRARARAGSPAAVTLDVMNRVYGRAIRALHQHPKPVVALVEGVAAGAGANLAFACDLVYATPDARFCEIFIRRGIALDCGGSWLLPRLVGLQRAKELAFFGDWISAETAREYGLVSAIFDADRIGAAVDEKLAALAERPPIALAQIKQSLHRATTVSMTEALEIEAVAQAACASTEDMAEGVRAFLEKRPPRFEGR